ncbi:MAG TPA: DMT family transporter [Solirubrobacteraceae bacterium]|nr:DMT family transporter [Solirubrobacteraceae bacterium]
MTRALERPGAVAVAGALTIAFSAILVKLADVEPATAAIFRCAYALPVLGVLAWYEDRRYGRRTLRERRLAIPAGIFFAADLIFWHHAIADVGAGLATVLGNTQVVVVPFVAWLLLNERVEARLLAALPLVCSGVVLISGVLETGAYGDHPVRGVVYGLLTGLSYAGFILVLRRAGADLRRPAGPLFDATAVATIAAIVAGVAVGEADLVPSWPAHGWLLLLALSSQVVGWLLISVSLPRLPAALTSVTLTIQPVGSVLLGVILLGENPSALQLVGVGCILAGLLAIARRPRIGSVRERATASARA